MDIADGSNTILFGWRGVPIQLSSPPLYQFPPAFISTDASFYHTYRPLKARPNVTLPREYAVHHDETSISVKIHLRRASLPYSLCTVALLRRTSCRASCRAPDRASYRALGRASCRALGRASCRALGRASCRALGRVSCRALGRASCRASCRALGRALSRASYPLQR